MLFTSSVSTVARRAPMSNPIPKEGVLMEKELMVDLVNMAPLSVVAPSVVAVNLVHMDTLSVVAPSVVVVVVITGVLHVDRA